MTKLRTALTRTDAELQAARGSILTTDSVASLLEIPLRQLLYVLYSNSPRYRYRAFSIKKRSGGTRTILRPSKSVAILQRKFLRALTVWLTPKAASHGFTKERSIITNASRHLGKRFVLNVDLVNFFGSINFGRVRGALMSKPLCIPADPASLLAHLCCCEGILPQGAPTSPAISNLICRQLDSELSRLSERRRCTYSRYADDITISTDLVRFPVSLAEPSPDWSGENLMVGDELQNIILRNGFTINHKKTRLQPWFGRQEVTGLVVNERITPPQRYIRQVRSMLHAAEKFGLASAAEVFFERHDRRNRHPPHRPPFEDILRGKIDYIEASRGANDRTVALLRNRLFRLCPETCRDRAIPPRQIPVGADPWEHWHKQYENSVYILQIDTAGGTSAGTGFRIGNDRIATARHNLKDGRGAISYWDRGQQTYLEVSCATVPRIPEIDCAIFSVASKQDCSFPISDKMPQLGEEIAALGFAQVPGHRPTLQVVRGSVASVPVRYFNTEFEVIHISLQTGGGMSGAPVIDIQGRVVGIVMETTFLHGKDQSVPPTPFFFALPAFYLTRDMVSFSKAS